MTEPGIGRNQSLLAGIEALNLGLFPQQISRIVIDPTTIEVDYIDWPGNKIPCKGEPWVRWRRTLYIFSDAWHDDLIGPLETSVDTVELAGEGLSEAAIKRTTE